MISRLLLLLLFISACGQKDDRNDPHSADGPLLPIELQEGREVLEVENDSHVLIARGQELAEFLVPRLVALMAQAELAEDRFLRPTQKAWLQMLRVDYRQLFNELYQLSGKYDYPLSSDLPSSMQAQTDALGRLNDASFRTAYLDLVRDQLRQLKGQLETYPVGHFNRDYQRVKNNLQTKVDLHLTQISRIFR